jgi:hypothetical protein
MSIEMMLWLVFIVMIANIMFAGWVIYWLGYSVWYVTDTIVKVNRSNS